MAKLKTLLEGEIEKAQAKLAARDMADQLQELLEKVTRIKVEDLPALKESLRSNMDPSVASAFESTASGALDSVITALTSATSELDNAAQQVADGQAPTGTGQDLEQAMNLGQDAGDEETGDDIPSLDGDEEGAPVADVAAGGETPLGRERREHKENLRRMIESLSRKIHRLSEAKKSMCNHSAKGKKCPVHGLKECSTMMKETAKKPMKKAMKKPMKKAAKKTK